MSWGRTHGQVIDINRSPKIEIPRLRKRQHSTPGSLSQISPREAERLRDGYDSTPDPAYSCLRCSAQRQTATWLLYRVLYSLLAGCSVCHFAHACPTMPSISLVYIYIRVVRSALNVVRAYFSPIFQYFSANNVTRVSFSQIFQYFVTYVCHAPWFSSALDSSALNSSAMDSSAMDSSTIGVGVTVRVGKIMCLSIR